MNQIVNIQGFQANKVPIDQTDIFSQQMQEPQHWNIMNSEKFGQIGGKQDNQNNKINPFQQQAQNYPPQNYQQQQNFNQYAPNQQFMQQQGYPEQYNKQSNQQMNNPNYDQPGAANNGGDSGNNKFKFNFQQNNPQSNSNQGRMQSVPAQKIQQMNITSSQNYKFQNNALQQQIFNNNNNNSNNNGSNNYNNNNLINQNMMNNNNFMQPQHGMMNNNFNNCNNCNPYEQQFQMEPQQQYMMMQNQKPKTLVCNQHNNSPVNLICFSQNCKEYSRLLCNFCIPAKAHIEHIDQAIPIENIQCTNHNEYLLEVGTIGKTLKSIQESGESYQQDNASDIQNQLDIVLNEFQEKYKKHFKTILQQVNDNNDNMQTQMETSLKNIEQSYSAHLLLEAISTYISSSQSHSDKIKLEEIIGTYAKLYNSEKLLTEMLPKKKLQVDTSKLEKVQQKLKEALMILSEVAFEIQDLKLAFQPSLHEDSNKHIKISNQGLMIMCTYELPKLAISSTHLPTKQKYLIECKLIEGDLSTHVCWGAVLISEKVKNNTTGLLWPKVDQGMFCCFDGDCYQQENALKSDDNISQKLRDPHFFIEFEQSAKIFKIYSKDKTFKYSLKNPNLIKEDEKYYLGFSISKSQLSINVIQ